jgi:hypothetical protein
VTLIMAQEPRVIAHRRHGGPVTVP